MKVAVPWPSWQCIRCGQRERQISAGTDSLSPAQEQNLTSHQVGDQLIHEVSFQGPRWQRQHLRTEFSVCAGSSGNAERQRGWEVKSGSGILLSTPGAAWECSPASRAVCPLKIWEELSQCLEIRARRHPQKTGFGLKNYASVWSLGMPGLGSVKLTERPFMKLSGDISKREK